MARKAKTPQAAQEPKQYLFKGNISLSGVSFSITANSEKEARDKAMAGDWDDYEILGASSEGCKIYPDTCELNE